MSQPIMLTEAVWGKLYRQLAQDYPSSVLLIREKMKVVLGFTVRRHREWIENPKVKKKFLEQCICLDFYNESKRTFFLLKYGEFLDRTQT